MPTPTPEIYTLSLHDALPSWESSIGRAASRCRPSVRSVDPWRHTSRPRRSLRWPDPGHRPRPAGCRERSEEHTSELQSLTNLVCRLLLEKTKKKRRHKMSKTI